MPEFRFPRLFSLLFFFVCFFPVSKSFAGQYTTTERINFKTSSIDTGGNLSISSGSNLISEGGAFKAGGNIVADVQGTIYNSEVQDVYSRSVEKEYLGDDSFVGSLAKMSSALTKVAITGGAALLDSGTLDELKEGAAGNNSEEENRSRTTARGGLFEAGGSIELGSEANQIYRGTDFKAGNDISLASEQGKVALLSIRDTENYSKTVKGKGALWQTDKGEGSYDESLKFGEMSAGGKINIRAKEGVDVDIQKREITYYEETPYGRVTRTRKETNREAIDRMVAEDPSKAWMSSLYQSGDLTLTSVEESHEDWEYDNSGLTQEAQIGVAIAASAFTGGAGAALLGTGTLGAGAGALIATAASTASVTSLNSLGRGEANVLGKTMESVQSSIVDKFSGDDLLEGALKYAVANIAQNYGVSGMESMGVQSNYLKAMGGAFAGSTATGLTTAYYRHFTGGEGLTDDVFSKTLEKGLTSAAMAGVNQFQEDLFYQKGTGYIGGNPVALDRSTVGDFYVTSIFKVVGISALRTGIDAVSNRVIGKLKGMSEEELDRMQEKTLLQNFLHNSAVAMRKNQIYSSGKDRKAGNLMRCKNSMDGLCIGGARRTPQPDGTYSIEDSELGGDQGNNENKRFSILGWEMDRYSSDGSTLNDILKSYTVEHFSGTHDFLNRPYYYDENGNNTPEKNLLGERPNEFNVILGSPFAAGSAMDKWFYYNHWQNEE